MTLVRRLHSEEFFPDRTVWVLSPLLFFLFLFSPSSFPLFCLLLPHKNCSTLEILWFSHFLSFPFSIRWQTPYHLKLSILWCIWWTEICGDWHFHLDFALYCELLSAMKNVHDKATELRNTHSILKISFHFLFDPELVVSSSKCISST